MRQTFVTDCVYKKTSLHSTKHMMKKNIFLIIFLFTGLNSFGQLLPQLRGVDCNRSNTQLYQNLYANITGGVQYRFKVTNNTTLVTDSITKATRGFNLNELLLSTGTIAPMTFKFKWIMVRGLVPMVIFVILQR